MTKSIFGIHDPVGLRYLFQLRVSVSPFLCPDYAILRATLAVSVINILQKKTKLFRKSIEIVFIWTSIHSFH